MDLCGRRVGQRVYVSSSSEDVTYSAWSDPMVRSKICARLCSRGGESVAVDKGQRLRGQRADLRL